MRFLVLDHGLLARDCAEVLRRMGHEVACHPPGRGPVLAALADADAFLSINLNPSLARAAARRKVPYAAWVVDPRVNRATLDAERAEASDFTWVFSYEEAQGELYREMGYPHVEYLPTGASPAFCLPEAPSTEVPVGFVGAPLVESTNEFVPLRRSLEAQAASGGEGARAAALILEVADACLASQRGDLVRFRIPEDLEALEKARGIRLIDAAWTDAKWQFVLALAKESARDHRLDVCRAAAPLGLGVWGPPEWEGALPEGARYEGAAPYPEGAREAYLRSAVSLNVTRIYAGDVVPNRVWDALACGGFVVTDQRPEARRLLGDALPCYRTPAEAAALARHFLERPEDREALAAHLRAVVLSRHTLAHRISRILERIAASV